MAEHTPHQKKIIERYYDRRGDIMLDKISELVTELYLADTDKQRNRLWGRVEAAMCQLNIKKNIAAHILTRRSPEILAQHVKDWVASSGGQPPKSGKNRQARPHK